MSSVHSFQLVFLLLLVFVTVFALLARRLKLAYPIVLVMAGLGVSFIPHVPLIPLNPDLVFMVFLPPLLFSSANQVSLREMRANAVSIGLLAFGLVTFTVLAVAAFSDRFITAMDWKSGFLLGAVVAATDSIAATSIASTLGLPRRIVDILEGESLLNDATALLALEFGLQALLQGTTPTVGEALGRLLWLVVGGTGIGLMLGWLAARLNAAIDDGPIQIVVSITVPYAAYLAGEAAHTSGVFAVVAAGLYLGRQSATIFSPEVRLQIRNVWEALTFLLNGVVFALIGLQLPLVLSVIRGNYSWPTLLSYAGIFSVFLIALRLVWVYPAAWLTYFIRRRLLRQRVDPPNPKSVFVIGWTGMRGVIALAAAISLPRTLANGQPYTAGSLILFLAFAIILVTLVVQGLTLPALIRGLGLASTGGRSEEECAGRRASLEAAIAYLEQNQSREAGPFSHVYDDLMHRYRHRLAAVGGGSEQEPEYQLDSATYQHLRAVAAGAVQEERATMIALRNRGELSDESLRRMERELDLLETRYRDVRK